MKALFTQIVTIIPSNGKQNSIFIQGTFDDLVKVLPFIAEREIVEIKENIEVELAPDEFIDENGILQVDRQKSIDLHVKYCRKQGVETGLSDKILESAGYDPKTARKNGTPL